MAKPITPGQLRCLQTLWSQKMRAAAIVSLEDSRELRHQYIAEASGGRAHSTKELSRSDAVKILRLLAAEVGGTHIVDADAAHAAGTHGRRGYDDGRSAVLVGEQQMVLLERLQRALGWDQGRLAAFAARQLGGQAAIRTMADYNRVIWPMKRMLRHQPIR